MLNAIKIKTKALINHQGFRRYAANTSWMMGEQFLRIIAGLFVGIWVARYLGPDQFGLFSYVLAFTAIFGGVAKLGLDGIVVRELINHPEKRDIYLGTAFWLKILGAIFVMGMMVAIVPFTSNDDTTNLFIFIVAAGLIFQSFEVVEFYFQSQVLAKIISICKVTQLALSSIIKIYLVLSEAELIWFVIVATLDALSLSVGYIIAYKLQTKSGFCKKFDLNIAKQLTKDGWPLVFSTFIVMIYMRIDQVMIKEMLSGHEVGIYSAAVRLSEAFYFIPMLITASLFPAILSSKKQNEELYQRRLRGLYTIMVWLAIAIAMPMSFLGGSFITLLFGESYHEAGAVLAIHIWAAVFVFLGVAFSKYLVAENLAQVVFERALLGAVVNILLNLWMINEYGVIGAALATLFAQFVANFLCDLVDKRFSDQWHMKIESVFIPWSVFK